LSQPWWPLGQRFAKTREGFLERDGIGYAEYPAAQTNSHFYGPRMDRRKAVLTEARRCCEGATIDPLPPKFWLAEAAKWKMRADASFPNDSNWHGPTVTAVRVHAETQAIAASRLFR
jgi:hypothetical protein